MIDKCVTFCFFFHCSRPKPLSRETAVPDRLELAVSSQGIRQSALDGGRRHEIFSQRLQQLVFRYEAVTSGRLRRLRQEGIQLDRDHLKRYARQRTYAANEERARNYTGLLRSKTDIGLERVSEVNFRLDVSFNARSPMRARRDIASTSPCMVTHNARAPLPSETENVKVNLANSLSKQHQHRHHCHHHHQYPGNSDDKIIIASNNPQPLTKRRHSLFSNVQIESAFDALRDAGGDHHTSAFSEYPGKCSIHTACSLTCRGRSVLVCRLPRRTDPLVPLSTSPTAVHRAGDHATSRHEAKFRKAMAKLSTVQQFRIIRKRYQSE